MMMIASKLFWFYALLKSFFLGGGRLQKEAAVVRYQDTLELLQVKVRTKRKGKQRDRET